jgi:hypothetical protein
MRAKEGLNCVASKMQSIISRRTRWPFLEAGNANLLATVTAGCR